MCIFYLYNINLVIFTLYLKDLKSAQNSTKSRNQSKLHTSQRTPVHIASTESNNSYSSPLNRSKSELDLSLNESFTSSNHSKNNNQSPTSTSKPSQHSTSMFGFFTRKRRSKSKSSLCASQSNLVVDSESPNKVGLSLMPDRVDSENPYGKYSSAYVSTSNLSKTKKRVAPPPPPPPATISNILKTPIKDKLRLVY